MAFLAALPAILGIVDKLIPDPAAAAAAKIEAMKLAQAGGLAELNAALEVNKAQAEINQVEASQDVYRGGWRPFCGWTCGGGLFYNFLVKPIVPWVLEVCGLTVPPLPPIDIETLMVLLTGMLGLGGLRTYEKKKGLA